MISSDTSIKPRFSLVLLILVTFPLGGISARAQRLEVVPPGEVQQKHEALKQAQAAWRKVDSGIEGRIFRLKPERALREIDSAAGAAQLCLEARDAYNQSLVRQARQQVANLEAFGVGSLGNHFEDLQVSTQRRLDDLAEQEKILLQKAGEKEDGIPAERQALIDDQAHQQLQQIIELKKSLYQQQDLLRKTQQMSQPFESARRALLDHSREILDMLETEADASSAETTLWRQYYDSLRGLVLKRTKDAPGGEKVLESGKSHERKP